MAWFNELARRLLMLLRRNRFDRDLEEEMRLHRELRMQDQIERGLLPEEANDAAQRRFGNDLVLREESRDMWGWNWLENLVQDVRYGVRMLVKNPGFTSVAVITLALGVGANTAIFSVVNGVLLSPLPFPNAKRIVSIFQDKPNFPKGSISYPNFLDWQHDNRTFELMAAYRWADGTIRGVGEPEDVKAQRVSATFFPILGVQPILGRNLSADEDRRGANPTVMISEGLWKRKFGSDPNVIGKRLIVAGMGRTIVGIVPSSFRLNIQNFRSADIYEPIGEETDAKFHQRDSFWGMDAIGLLRPGVTLEQAREDMKRVNASLAAAYPDINANIKANIITLKDEIVGDISPVLLVLFGAVGFVLLISCVNVANLLLARSTSRRREFAIRVSLGAGEMRVIRQLLTESLMLAVIGAALGLLLAQWGTAAAVAAVPSSVPRAEEIALDVRVLLFTLGVSVIAGVVFGLVPALKTSYTKIGETLKDTGRAICGYRSGAQAVFVVGEMAMALVLLIGAGLMIRTMAHLWQLDPGFDPHNVLGFGIYPPPSLADRSPDAVRAAYRQIHSIIHSMPGVGGVSLNWGAHPMEGDDEVNFWPEGQEQPTRQADLASSLEYVVEPDYLQTMRIPLLRGRFINEGDNEHSERVAVIDSSFAQKYFAGQNPIGKHIHVLDFDRDATQRTWLHLTVVGIVGHVKQFGLADDSSHPLQAQLYRPFMQAPDLLFKKVANGVGAYVRFRSSLSSEAFFQTIRKKLLASNGEMIVSGNQSEEEVVAGSISSRRFSTVLLGAFAALALMLAAVGIYGVLSYLVGQRTQEIGVRMALGARRLDVLRMVLRDGARMTLAGAAIGVAGALGLTRFMASMLFGVKPADPLTFGAVAVLLCGIALFACYVPARRAMRVDPMTALRHE
jgi:predicted permease